MAPSVCISESASSVVPEPIVSDAPVFVNSSSRPALVFSAFTLYTRMCSVRTIQKSGAPLCACRGIRVCSLCEQEKHTSGLLKNSSEFVQLAFCSQCSKAFSDESPGKPACPDHSDGFKFFGITILDEFLSEEEEADLIRKIDASPWVPSQSGRSKQVHYCDVNARRRYSLLGGRDLDYGAKVNFKKRRISTKYFTGLPDYSRSLVERLHHRMRNNGARFKDFYPVELCNLEYLPERGAAIVPHLDDTWLWGERLVLLNLASPTRMTFTLPANGPGVPGEWERYKTFAASYLPPSQASYHVVAVSLPRRSLLIIADKARFTWLHAINRNEVLMRRLSLTMRELSNEFLGVVRYHVHKYHLPLLEPAVDMHTYVSLGLTNKAIVWDFRRSALNSLFSIRTI
ncbi:unnamed protein product [Mesocestoides corti]|uniref:Fe2OG dioxygenase domain-containing protein n=1 Tax=Mesocestoides corti TaxID=53468 RepID=A0A0R3UP62_MESCO|nr:unnamed protein product [Mesocestoides corti]